MREELDVIAIKRIFWYCNKQEKFRLILLEHSTRQNRMQTIFKLLSSCQFKSNSPLSDEIFFLSFFPSFFRQSVTTDYGRENS